MYRFGTPKYKNRKVEYEGLVFDSKKEMKRYIQLEQYQKAGAISDLKRQVKYLLIPAQREPDTVGIKGGRKQGKLIEREVAYYADFEYIDTNTGEKVVEDTKGMKTKEYILKRKMMLYFHGVRIKEV